MKFEIEKPTPTAPRSATGCGFSRRQFLKAPATLAAVSLILPSAIGVALTTGAQINPRYSLLENFVPEIDLRGKVAVIIGACGSG